MKKRDLLAGSGAIAAALALYTAMDAGEAQVAAPLEPEQVIAVDSTGTAAVSDTAEDGALAPSEKHTRWAIGAAFGTLIGGFAAAIGFNRLMNWLAAGQKAAVAAAGSAARATGNATRKAARVTGEAAARLFDGPGRVAAKSAVIGLGTLVAIALLDVSWKASLAVGAGSLILGAFGWRRPAPKPVPVKVRKDL